MAASKAMTVSPRQVSVQPMIDSVRTANAIRPLRDSVSGRSKMAGTVVAAKARASSVRQLIGSDGVCLLSSALKHLAAAMSDTLVTPCQALNEMFIVALLLREVGSVHPQK